jgi:hypothetical protein
MLLQPYDEQELDRLRDHGIQIIQWFDDWADPLLLVGGDKSRILDDYGADGIYIDGGYVANGWTEWEAASGACSGASSPPTVLCSMPQASR